MLGVNDPGYIVLVVKNGNVFAGFAFLWYRAAKGFITTFAEPDCPDVTGILLTK